MAEDQMVWHCRETAERVDGVIQ